MSYKKIKINIIRQEKIEEYMGTSIDTHKYEP